MYIENHSLTDYLESQYSLAWSDFRLAWERGNVDAQWAARREIARLERTAAETCGFQYADYLKRQYGHYDDEQ